VRNSASLSLLLAAGWKQWQHQIQSEGQDHRVLVLEVRAENFSQAFNWYMGMWVSDCGFSIKITIECRPSRKIHNHCVDLLFYTGNNFCVTQNICDNIVSPHSAHAWE